MSKRNYVFDETDVGVAPRLHVNWLLLLSPVIAALVHAIKFREEESASPKRIRGMPRGGIIGYKRVA